MDLCHHSHCGYDWQRSVMLQIDQTAGRRVDTQYIVFGFFFSSSLSAIHGISSTFNVLVGISRPVLVLETLRLRLFLAKGRAVQLRVESELF